MTYIIGSGYGAKVAHLGETTFWASNGRINVQHPKEGHKTITIKEALERAKWVGEVIRNSSQKELVKYADTRERIQKFLDDIVDVCKQAQLQGEYTDESMMRDKIRRRPKSIAVPASFGKGL